MSLFSLPGHDDPDYQSWVMLLNGYGFNWYRLDNQMRADDLLIRSKASENLAAACTGLRLLEAEFRQLHLPSPSREAPFPDASKLQAAARIRRLQERIAASDTKLRGAAVPVDDKIWARHRDETQMLASLIHFDTILIGTTEAIVKAVAGQNADSITRPEMTTDLERRIGILEAALVQRADLLGIMPTTGP
jgi:hypothetical protein